MIGLVIVSHSYQLAEGVREIADQMAGGEIQIAAAGGLLDGDTFILGTEPFRIQAAIESVWSDDGVLILLDMGSAVLCAEMAVEMLSPEQQERCLLSNAPLVEGAIVAALQASLGQTLIQVNQAAEAALHSHKVDRSY